MYSSKFFVARFPVYKKLKYSCHSSYARVPSLWTRSLFLYREHKQKMSVTYLNIQCWICCFIHSRWRLHSLACFSLLFISLKIEHITVPIATRLGRAGLRWWEARASLWCESPFQLSFSLHILYIYNNKFVLLHFPCFFLNAL